VKLGLGADICYPHWTDIAETTSPIITDHRSLQYFILLIITDHRSLQYFILLWEKKNDKKHTFLCKWENEIWIEIHEPTYRSVTSRVWCYCFLYSLDVFQI